MKQWTALLLLVGMAHFSAHSASARTACKTACGDEFRCEIKGAKCLIDSGQISDAIDHLKEILAKRPGDRMPDCMDIGSKVPVRHPVGSVADLAEPLAGAFQIVGEEGPPDGEVPVEEAGQRLA